MGLNREVCRLLSGGHVLGQEKGCGWHVHGMCHLGKYIPLQLCGCRRVLSTTGLDISVQDKLIYC